MKMMKSMLLGSFLVMGLSFCVSAEVPSAPPSGLKDLGVDATVQFGSNAADEWNVDKAFLLKKGERTGLFKESFAFCASSNAPWFIVTLNTPAEIKKIYIQNRVDVAQERAKGLTVSVSNDQKTWKEIWKATDVQPEWNIELKTPEKVQYIKFEVPHRDGDDGFLHLNNVRIYGN